MILNFRSRVLRRFWEGETRRVQPPAVARRIMDILVALQEAEKLSNLEHLPGFHRLSGNRAQEYAVVATRNWRVTFIPVTEYVNDPDTGETQEIFHVQDVDYEDYH